MLPALLFLAQAGAPEPLPLEPRQERSPQEEQEREPADDTPLEDDFNVSLVPS